MIRPRLRRCADTGPATVPYGWGAVGLPLMLCAGAALYFAGAALYLNEDAPLGAQVRQPTGTGRDHLRATR